jgi:hypothetical protein
MDSASRSVEKCCTGKNVIAAEHLAVGMLCLFFLVLGFRLLQSITCQQLVERGPTDS